MESIIKMNLEIGSMAQLVQKGGDSGRAWAARVCLEAAERVGRLQAMGVCIERW